MGGGETKVSVLIQVEKSRAGSGIGADDCQGVDTHKPNKKNYHRDIDVVSDVVIWTVNCLH